MCKEIPLLEAQDIECRVQSVKENKGKVNAILLLYKDARVDMRVLDAVYGSMNWQRTHEVVNGNLFCSIDIWDEDKKHWVRKQDVGVESNTEKEKGQASDAFKRAGFNVGIGRELYTSPFIYIELKDDDWYRDNKNNIKCNARFDVKEIGYNDRREINRLVIVDSKKAERFTFGKKVPKPIQYVCEVCGKQFADTIVKGKKFTAKDLHDGIKRKYGQAMCEECVKLYKDMKGADKDA